MKGHAKEPTDLENTKSKVSICVYLRSSVSYLHFC
jgi:hypothetical protein